MKKGFGTLLLCLTAASVIFAVPASVKAELTVAETPWSRPTFVHGTGLNEAQVQETATHLGVTGKDLLQMNIDSKDILRYIGKTASDSGMISSALVTKLKEGEGVRVDIKTPDNITEITEVQYANAAITAGVKDLQIDVAAIRPVTGSSALTGVYKAMEANGVLLDKDRMTVAQDELETVNEITKENSGNTSFTKQNFDTLIINIKNELNIYYNNLPEDKKITREDIQRIVLEAMTRNKLNNVLTQDQITRIVSFFEKYAKTDAISSEEVISQLKDLSGSILDRAQDLYGEAQASGFFDRIAQFFQEIFEAIARFFQNLGSRS